MDRKLPDSNLDAMRHSTAHLMAAAVKLLWPETKFGVGPVIENGFYYDFELPVKVTEEDLPKIEKKMEELKSKNLPIEREELPIDEAFTREEKNQQPYKAELIEQIKETGDTRLDHAETASHKHDGTKKPNKVSYYRLGNFVDLCRGPHVSSTGQIGYFKLLNIAGAYWRGSEKNPMLTRIYGTVWSSKEELENHLTQLEEVKRRDHKKLGPELELFMFHETAPGMPYWLPKGLTVLNLLIEFWRKDHEKREYQEIASPLINDKSLWETSGHWEHYREDMFIIPVDENITYGVKPMNCPNAMVVFGSKTRSYRDLPFRLSDTDVLHRFEKSGTLNGLLRARKFQQDDAHIFISEDQIESEYKEILAIAEDFYSIFDLEYRLRLGTRPEKYLGSKRTWDKAEDVLKKILEASGREHFVLEGDGAFYGPKIDILMKDALGREWQMGTIQLDFQLPARFNLKYSAADGTEKMPVVIHRVIYGTLERFIGILIENYAGAFPVWLAPVQAVVLPITDRNKEYASSLSEKLRSGGLRVELDDRSETLQARIRDAQIQKTPYMLVVGDKEEKAGTAALRLRTGEDEGEVKIEEFVKRVQKIVADKRGL